MLIPVEKTVLDSNGLFVMNKSGLLLGICCPMPSICKAVLAEYKVSPEEAAQDIAEFLNTCVKWKFSDKEPKNTARFQTESAVFFMLF